MPVAAAASESSSGQQEHEHLLRMAQRAAAALRLAEGAWAGRTDFGPSEEGPGP